MNKIKYIFIIFIFIGFVSNPSFSKPKEWNETNSSVQHLQNLTIKGRDVRANDVPLEKADIKADTIRVKEIKDNYYKKHNLQPKEIQKKIPD